MATSLCTAGPYLTLLGPIRSHNPNGIPIGSAAFAQGTAECAYTLQRDGPFPLKIAPSHGDLDPYLIHGVFGSPKSSTQTASRTVQPFCRLH